ncbi:MAG: YkyA family protein [Rickettsiales bacterium]|nr:YkyA family protein [Rickettsiales bacterium]
MVEDLEAAKAEKARRDQAEEALRDAERKARSNEEQKPTTPAASDASPAQATAEAGPVTTTRTKEPSFFNRVASFLGIGGDQPSTTANEAKAQATEMPRSQQSAPRPKLPLFEVRSVDSAVGAEAIDGADISVVRDAQQRWDNGRALEQQLSDVDSRLASRENKVLIGYDKQVSDIFAGGYRDGGAAVDAQAERVRELLNSVNYSDYQSAEGTSHSVRMAKLDAYIAAKEEQTRQLQSIGAGSVVAVSGGYKPISEEAASRMTPANTSIERYREVANQLRELEGDKNKAFNEAGEKGMTDSQKKSLAGTSERMMALQEERALIENSPEFQKRVSERIAEIDNQQKSIAEQKAKLSTFDGLFEKARTETLTNEEKEKFGPMIENRRDLLRQESALKNERLDLVEAQNNPNSEVNRIVLQNVKERTENQIADQRLKTVNDNFTSAGKAALDSTTGYMDRLVEARSESPTGQAGWNAGVVGTMVDQAKLERDNKLAPIQNERTQIAQARNNNFITNLNVDTMVDAQNSKGPDLSNFIVQKDEAGRVTQLNMPPDARLEIIPAGLGQDGKRNYNMRIVGSSDAAFQTVAINNVSSNELKTLINAGDEGTLRVVFKGDANKAPELNIASSGAQVEFSKVRVNAVASDVSNFEEAGQARDRRYAETLDRRTEQARTNLARAQQIGEIKDLEKMAKQAAKGTLAQNVGEGDLGGMKAPVPGRANSNYIG